MAENLKKEIGRNSVRFTTHDKKYHIDLFGKAHYDKASKQYIPTPHVQAHVIYMSIDGKSRASKKPITMPATKDDIRLARRLAGR